MSDFVNKNITIMLILFSIIGLICINIVSKVIKISPTKMESKLNNIGFVFNEKYNFYEKEGKFYSIVDETNDGFFLKEVFFVPKQ